MKGLPALVCKGGGRCTQQPCDEKARAQVQEARDKCSVFTSGASKVVKKVEPLFDQAGAAAEIIWTMDWGSEMR